VLRLSGLASGWLSADALEARLLQALLLVVAGQVGLVPRGWPPCHAVRRQVAFLGHHSLPTAARQNLGQLGVIVREAGVVLAELALVAGPEPVRG
jgi:hypothetical protein